MSTLNGIGTKFLGECEHHADGSYIATRWFTFVYLPIIPLYSARIFGIEPESALSATYHYAELPMHWPQVMRTYGFIAAIVAFFSSLPFFLEKHNVNPLFIFPVGLALLVTPWFLQRRSRQQAVSSRPRSRRTR